MKYSIDEISQLKPMSYWAFKGKSLNLKKKFADAFEKDYILTLKRDGALYRAILKGDGEENLLQSRTISRVTGEYVEKQDRVPAIMAALEVFPENTVVVGEICFPLEFGNTISSDVVSIMGCNADKAIHRQEATPVNFYIFDVLAYDGEDWWDKPYSQRIKKVQEMAKVAKNENRLEFAKPIYENIENELQNYLDHGWEGGVLMKANMPYAFEKRPAWTSIKVKQATDTIDLVIMGTTPANKDYTGKYHASHQFWENVKTGELVEGTYYGDGGYTPVAKHYFKGMIGGLQLGAYYGDNLIEVSKVANLTDDIREAVTADPESYIGRVVEVSAMMIDVEKKSLRHPILEQFREDKDAEDCLYSDIFQ